MDKEPYETFQFIETNNTNSDMNQLLVLQEDGTLLSVNRDIQYITQVQDVKGEMEEVQACTVFDVSSQQFYVDVENASTLIVPPDQFTLQHADENIYSNSFLIQPENSATSEPMETDSSISLLKSGEEIHQSEPEAANSSKLANNFTEITLTDEQYHLLEQKGWVLLEFSERIFVLDTLGLHDITSDENLIQKLKRELEDATTQLIEPEQMKTENAPSPAENIKDETFEVEIPLLVKNTGHAESGKVMEDSQTVNEHPEESSGLNTDVSIDLEVQSKQSGLESQQGNEINKKCDSIKIKTKYTFSDIPDKIFLGKTINGKKLYAKVTKSKHKDTMKMAMLRKAYEKDKNMDNIDDLQFINMLQEYIREHPSKIKLCNVIAADSVVSQLMRMPHIKDNVVGNYVVVTKAVIFVAADGKEKTRRKPTTITGEVKPLDDTHGRFVHTPYMLHNMACQKSSIAEESQQADSIDKITQEFVEFVHIHITETKVPGRPSIQAINVCNRKVSLDVIRDAKKRYPNPVYACGACAAVFKSQSTLTDHLENYCSGTADPDDTLTIDTDQLNDQTETYYKIDTGKEKWYACMQCEAKFSKLFNCKKHIKSHSKPLKKNRDSDEPSDPEIKEYKCKMCSSKYFHASSLSKHIVKRHIQVHYNHSNKQPLTYIFFNFNYVMYLHFTK